MEQRAWQMSGRLADKLAICRIKTQFAEKRREIEKQRGATENGT
jgi:hypothetical protein